MPIAPRSLKEVFLEALAVPPAERAAWLDRECAHDAELRRHIDLMVAAHDAPQSLLDRVGPPAGSAESATRSYTHTESMRPGTVVGPYKLLEQIGEGGFGVVFLAEQMAPIRRKVALKILKPGMDTKQVVARFEAERQALALMDHPNIASVYDAATTTEGRPYFVMELVRGIPITQFCDDKRQTTRDRLGLFLQVCRAVQHAHQKGVIHRDIKPSNVLVTLHDGTPVAKVIDFGIAKALGQPLSDKTLFTGYAQMVGTPLYMSPEQAALSGLDVDTRSDVYALGVLLYELLTGTTPLDRDRLTRAGYDELRRIIREEEPPRPSSRISTLGRAADTVSTNRQSDPKKLSQLVRGDLDWIVMKCLEKDRNRRYDTVSALAADIQRFLADEPVLACPPSAWYRFGKFTRRNRREVLAAGVAAVAGMTGMTGLGVSQVLIARERDAKTRAEEERQKADEREKRADYFHRITLAHRDLGLEHLANCPQDLRDWEWYYLTRLCRVEPLVISDTTEFDGVAFSRDGKRLASAGGDGTVKVWNGETGERVQGFKAHSGSVASVAFHPDGRHLATAGADRLVKVWDLTNDPPARVFVGPCDAIRMFGTAYTVAFGPDGRQLAAGGAGVVTVWDWKDDQPLHTFAGHEFHSIPVAFSPDGRHLATGGAPRAGQRLWDLEAGTGPVRTFPGHRHPVTALAFSPDGGRLASASLDHTVNVWDTKTGTRLYTLLHTGGVECVAFSPSGRRLASSGEDKKVRIWDVETGREVLVLHGHRGRCGCLAFSPDGWRLASASVDRTIHIWDATPVRENEGQEALTYFHTDEVYSVAAGPDGHTVAAAGYDPIVKVWDAETRQPRFQLTGHTLVVFSVAWQPGGQRIAAAGSKGWRHTVTVWDLSDEHKVFEIPAGRDYFEVPFSAVAFSPVGGRYLVTGKADGTVQVWDAESGREVGTLGTHEREIRGLVFSPDGRHLATSGDGKVKLWDAARLGQKKEPRYTLEARVPGPSLNVAFTADGRGLVTGGEKNTVKIWDVQTGKELHSLEDHSGDVYAVAVSRDGRWVASGGEDSTVKVWDARNGYRLARTFRGHTGLVSSLSFGPGGQRLYSGSRDKTVKVWDLTPLTKVPER